MKKVISLFALIVLSTAQYLSAVGFDELYSRAESLARRTEGKVFRDIVTPHWLPDNRHFWYRVTTAPDTREYVLVLEKANKNFDLVVMTGTGHGSAETPYGSRRRVEFLVKNLLGEDDKISP